MVDDPLGWGARDVKPGDTVVVVKNGGWDNPTYKRVKVAKIGGANGSLIFTDDGRAWKRNGQERGHDSWRHGDTLRSVERPELLDAFLAEAKRARDEERERVEIMTLIEKTRMRNLPLDGLRAIRAIIAAADEAAPPPPARGHEETNR